jgi:hypothetical protein
MQMKKLLAFALIAILAGTAMADTGWLPSYVFMNDGVGDTWYDLNAAFQPENFDGANLGTFELTSVLWLNAEINAWADGGDTYNYMSVYWRLGSSGGFTEQQDNSLVNVAGNDWQAVTPGVDLIAAAGSAGNYIVQIYLERSHDWSGGGPYITQLDASGDTGGAGAADYFEAEFTINAAPIPEPATMSLLGLGALAMVLRRKIRK